MLSYMVVVQKSPAIPRCVPASCAPPGIGQRARRPVKMGAGILRERMEAIPAATLMSMDVSSPSPTPRNRKRPILQPSHVMSHSGQSCLRD